MNTSILVQKVSSFCLTLRIESEMVKKPHGRKKRELSNA